MDIDLANLALRQRSCDTADRIPDARYPLYSETLSSTIAIGALAPASTVDFKAERDTIITDLSVSVLDGSGGRVDGAFSAEYCDTTLVEDSDLKEWWYCCQRKPIFLQGVRENKTLSFSVRIYAAEVGVVTAQVTVTGYQGEGCCS